MAADTSFAKACENLQAMLHIPVCTETIRTLVEGHGQAMARFQPTDEATAVAFRAAPGAVEVAVDAGKVNTREDGWKDLKIAVISKRESGEAVSPAGWESQRLPAATMVLAFAMIATAKVFRQTWRARLRHLGVKSLAAVHALGDGAGWIWKSFERALTGCVQTLDVYHAGKRLAKAAKKIFGEGTTEMKSAYERGRSLLIEQGWPGVCAWVAELLTVADEKERERRRAITEGVIGYFSKHLTRLNYAERLGAGRAIGSGVVEGQAKTLGLRMKARGARWKRAHVQPMASLVCVRNSKQWDAYWIAA